MDRARVKQQPVPPGVLAELRDSTSVAEDPAALRDRMREDGYVLVRRVVAETHTAAARREVLERLEAVGEIASPATEGVATGESRRRELHPDLGAFWQSVSEGPHLRRVTHGPELRALVSRLLGEEACPHDYLFLRVGTRGKHTDLHHDMPFFCRGSSRVHTAWIALGEVDLDQGPLMVLEGSHRFEDLLAPVRRIDYDSPASPRVAAVEDAVTLAQSRGVRLLTTRFGPGDAIVFDMTLMHGSLDHHQQENRVRLSCDIRFQPSADPRDPRYFGPNPTGTTGAGYGELNGAKPLTDSWHVR